MLPPPRTDRRWRPFAKLWHRWFGLLGGLWLLLLAVTGSAITFYEELDSWLNPDWRTLPAAAAGPPAPLDQVLARATEAVPGFAPGMIQMPSSADGTIWMLGRARPGGAPARIQLFSDPRDGAVLGWRELGRLSLDRRHLMDLVYGLHVDLLAGPWMTWFFGLVSLAWLIDHLVGLWLALPRGAQWRRALALGGRRRSLRRLFDWHRAPGMWSWPVTFVLALTGVTLAWPVTSREAVSVVAPVGGRLHESWPDVAPPVDAIGLDAAVAAVAPGRAGLHSLRLLPDHAAYAVRTYDPRDTDYQGRLWTYVSMTDGRILASRHDNGESPGDLFFAWQYPLHSGQALGEPGRWIVFASGIPTAGLVITGWLLWWRRRASRRFPRTGARGTAMPPGSA
ncbi:PepSY-associated TM helix domain-containing protein [Sphingosinicella terrae]|uniref:PepSY-associated TM helix domain-containing protein n=1 Tax=Sphingosinicella terrae TaxID=2172047 RepID=UPI000E0DA7BF|nr:PepSY-associated TM helix domain-containing protein [Sphingosinicella terrae]